MGGKWQKKHFPRHAILETLFPPLDTRCLSVVTLVFPSTPSLPVQYDLCTTKTGIYLWRCFSKKPFNSA